MVKNKTAQLRTWHHIEVIGAILGIVLILGFISVLSSGEFSEAQELPTYYVSTLYGSDNYSGSTKDDPMKTVNNVVRRLTAENQEDRSVRIVFLGEYTGRVDLQGLGTVVLEGGSTSLLPYSKLTGSIATPGASLISAQNVRRLEVNNLEVAPQDIVRPLVTLISGSEIPSTVSIKNSTFRGAEAIRLVNQNESTGSGNLKLTLNKNVFYVTSDTNTPLITDAVSVTQRNQPVSLTLEATDNTFRDYSQKSTPLIVIDEFPGFASILNNSFMAKDGIVIEGVAKFSSKMLLEKELISSNRFGQVIN